MTRTAHGRARRWTALLVVAAASTLAPVAAAHDQAAPPPGQPTALVVGLGLGDPVLQAGVVRGGDVILARGFEVDLARALAHRLGARVERFVHVPSTTRLLTSSSGARWHLALAGIEPSTAARALGDLSAPYATTDVAVVPRRGLPRTGRLSELRRLQLCAVRESEEARAAADLRSRRAVMLVPGAERLRTVVRTGACDAALVPAYAAGRFVAGWKTRLGPVEARIPHGDGLVAVVGRTSGLDVTRVDAALVELRRDGTLARLARSWLGHDPAALRVLR